jgi:hypothetical protein
MVGFLLCSIPERRCVVAEHKKSFDIRVTLTGSKKITAHNHTSVVEALWQEIEDDAVWNDDDEYIVTVARISEAEKRGE